MSSFEISKKFRLRENAINHIGETEYPHLDKKYLQYYSADAIAFCRLPDISFYGMLLNSYLNYRNSIVIEYCGKKITYEDFINNVERYANAFEVLGIEKDDIIPIISPNLPEVFYCIYALNKIGAIASLIDSKSDIKTIDEYLNKLKSPKIIILDTLYFKLKNLIEKYKINQVYTISEYDFLPLGLNYIMKAKKFEKNLESYSESNIYNSLKKIILQNKINLNEETIYEKLHHQEKRNQDIAL